MISRIIEEDIRKIVDERLPWGKLQNKTVLVTGASGFFGVYLCRVLVGVSQKYNLHLKIIGADFTEINPEIVIIEDQKFEYFQVDLRDSKAFKRFGEINIVMNSAAIIGPWNYNNIPVFVITTELLISHNILEYLRKQIEKNPESKPLFLQMSSSQVYGSTIKDGPISETDPTILDTQKVLSCYGESKRHTESLGISYSKQFGIESKIVRFSQMMGPGIPIGFGVQGAISDFLYNIVNNENLVITTDGKSKRAQGYITDAILGYFYVLFFGEDRNAYNVTNMNNLRSIQDLAAEVVKNSKKNLQVVFDSSNYIPQHQQFNAICLNTIKLEKLGWRPQVGFEEMVSRTVRYYEETESNKWWYRDYT